MAQGSKRLPVMRKEQRGARAPEVQGWPTLQNLQREVDRLFEDFDVGGWRPDFGRAALEPFWPGESSWSLAPAMDAVEEDKAYKITAELPGLDEKDVEIVLAGDTLAIKGEKKEEKEEKKKDYYLSERHYGAFERRFQVPPGVETGKIDASFRNGVLTITLPKTPEAVPPQKKIAIKSA